MATMIASMGRPSARPSEEASQQLRGVPGWCWGLYLGLILCAELVTALWSIQIGVAIHLALLFVLPIHGTFVAGSSRALLTVMTLAPLIRVVNLAMPVVELSLVNQYLVLSVPLAAALLMTVRLAGLTRAELGLRLDRLPLQIGIGLLGLPIGGLIYAILQPPPPFATPTLDSVLIAVLVFLVAVGFLEEVIFRGALQTVGERTLGSWAPLYVSALFASLHVGYLSPPHVGFVFLIGLIFARLAALGRSVVGVALAHGLTNVVVYLVFPFVLVGGGWTLPDVSWTGYSSSVTIEWAAAPSSAAAILEPTVAAETGGVLVTMPAAPPTDDHLAGASVAAPLVSAIESVDAAPQPAIRRIERPVFLPQPPVQWAPPAQPAPQRVRVSTLQPVNVRVRPGLDADVLTTAENDTVLLEDGRPGWIASDFVEAEDSAPAAVAPADADGH